MELSKKKNKITILLMLLAFFFIVYSATKETLANFILICHILSVEKKSVSKWIREEKNAIKLY